MFPGEKEKQLVPQGGSADVRAVQILMERRPAQILTGAEPVVGIQIGVAKVFVGVAMETVGAALGGDLNHSTAVAAEFRAHVVGRNSEFLHRVLGENECVDVVLSDVRRNAIDEEQALAAECAANLVISIGDWLRLTAGFEIAAAAIGHGAALGSTAGNHSRYKVQKVVHVAAVQRSLDHLLAFDHSIQCGAVGMQVARRPCHHQGLGHIPNLQRDVDTGESADLHIDLASPGGFESLLRHGQGVETWIQVMKTIGPALAGHGGCRGIRAVVLQGHCRAQYVRPRGIGDGAHHGSIASLRLNAGPCADTQQ